ERQGKANKSTTHRTALSVRAHINILVIVQVVQTVCIHIGSYKCSSHLPPHSMHSYHKGHYVLLIEL
ncbi:hypothetical protein GBAR_LOCUS24869, partial [Geodia barretti]